MTTAVLNGFFSPEIIRGSYFLNGVPPMAEIAEAGVLAGVTGLPQMFVYFIRCGDYIKIGSSRHPEKRVEHLRRSNKTIRPSIWAGNPKLIGYLPGEQLEELTLHRQFKDSRDKGEWFRVTPELEAHAESVLLEQARLEVLLQDQRRRNYCEDSGIECPPLDLNKITQDHLEELRQK